MSCVIVSAGTTFAIQLGEVKRCTGHNGFTSAESSKRIFSITCDDVVSGTALKPPHEIGSTFLIPSTVVPPLESIFCHTARVTNVAGLPLSVR